MFLKKLNLINFRNYPSMTLTFPRDGALLEGLNGAGKTNLLEAIHLLCTGRSQRGASRGDMIAHGEDSAFVEGEFVSAGTKSGGNILRDDSTSSNISIDNSIDDGVSIISHDSNNSNGGNGGVSIVPNDNNDSSDGSDYDEYENITTVSLGFSRDKKIVMKRDGVDVHSFSEWFGERPVVSFGTDDLELVYGAPETRRKFIDMLISQMDRTYLDALTSYRKNMLCRNALLGRTNDPVQFDVYELAMANAATILVSRRAEVIAELAALTSDFYAQISDSRESASIEYMPRCGAPKIVNAELNIDPQSQESTDENTSSIPRKKGGAKYDFDTIEEWRDVYIKALSERRAKDAELMFTSHGPHRDDLRFLMGGRAAKTCASQGQCRSIALSLKLGSAALLERRKFGQMIFLIDDAVSELDSERTSRVYPLIEGRGQIFIATPQCQATLGGGIMKCKVADGKVTTA